MGLSTLISYNTCFKRFLLTDNYESVTKQHYRSAKGSNGEDNFPTAVISKDESGFIRERPLTVPTVTEVNYN